MIDAMRRRAETHHVQSEEPFAGAETFLGFGGNGTWGGAAAAVLEPQQQFRQQQQQQQHQQPLPLQQRGFLNCFFWCGGPSGNIAEDEDGEEDEEDPTMGLSDVSDGTNHQNDQNEARGACVASDACRGFSFVFSGTGGEERPCLNLW